MDDETRPPHLDPLVVGGLFELTIGVKDLDAAERYWSRFGYTRLADGALRAEAALARYGVNSAMAARRLGHGSSDHGLIRLICWERPTHQGLGLTPLRALGSRWGAALTTSLLRVQGHCEAAAGAAGSVAWIPSVRQDPAGPVSEPFVTDQICVREMVVLRPESRQVLFERFGYANPTYGTVVEAPFPTSQVTHSGLVTTGDPEVFLGFYESLGMLRTRDGSVSKADDMASQRIFDLGPEESYLCWDFDDPRSSPVPSKWLSGRLKFIHFPTGTPLEDARAKAQLGGLGHTAYTWRVRDLDAVCALTDAIVVAEPGPDEFGARTARLIAPDGYDWLFIETPSTAAPAESAG